MAHVYLRNKRIRTGQLVQIDAKYVVLLENGQEVAIPRKQVEAVETI